MPFFSITPVAAGLDAAIFHAGKVLPMHLIKDEEKRFAEDLVFNRRLRIMIHFIPLLTGMRR